jgi:putative ABC transport system ATP-binding protein
MKLNSVDKPILETVELKKSYFSGRLETPALKGINISLKKGEFVALTGPSGSGKTTFLNLAGMLDNPTDGKIFLGGLDVSTLTESKKTALRLEHLGFVFQFFNLFPELTALENVYLPMKLIGKSKTDYLTRAKKLLSQVGLANRFNHRPSELSGGEQQRVAIARALANQPALILADEPTANLDSTTAAEIINLFKELNQRSKETILMVTHEAEWARKASRIVRLKDGKIIA